jgi:hypothetical protein
LIACRFEGDFIDEASNGLACSGEASIVAFECVTESGDPVKGAGLGPADPGADEEATALHCARRERHRKR